MSNPYAPPQATSEPDDPKGSAIDLTLDRLRFRRRVCGVFIGVFLILPGLATLAIAFGTSDAIEAIAFGVVGASLFGVGVFACLGYGWPAYAAAALAVIWLTFLAATMLDVSSADEPQRFQAMLIIRLFLATPTVVLLPLAVIGIATDRAIRRRQAESARQETTDATDRLEA